MPRSPLPSGTLTPRFPCGLSYRALSRTPPPTHLAPLGRAVMTCTRKWNGRTDMKRFQMLLALTLLLPLAALGQTGTAKTAHDLSVPPNCTAASGSGTAYTCATAPSFVPAAGDHIQDRKSTSLNS